MSGFFQALKGYVWWTYERGSAHYDIMVTLILIFIFLAPHKIDFRDKPAERPAHLIAYPDGQDGFVCEVPASAIRIPAALKGDAGALRSQLVQAIEPVMGPVTLVRFEPIQDGPEHVAAYRAWVKRVPAGARN
jgi:hypothetical protein